MPPWLLLTMLAWTAILAFAVGAKLHLPIVQAAGWARMTANYAALMPVGEALETALSGRELCAVCEYVRSAENARQTTDALVAKSLASADVPALVPDHFTVILKDTGDRPAWAAPENRFGEPRRGLPETPPPRRAA